MRIDGVEVDHSFNKTMAEFYIRTTSYSVILKEDVHTIRIIPLEWLVDRHAELMDFIKDEVAYHRQGKYKMEWRDIMGQHYENIL